MQEWSDAMSKLEDHDPPVAAGLFGGPTRDALPTAVQRAAERGRDERRPADRAPAGWALNFAG